VPWLPGFLIEVAWSPVVTCTGRSIGSSTVAAGLGAQVKNGIRELRGTTFGAQ
jgi:hypothetical protein